MKAFLEEVARQPVLAVYFLGVDAIDIPHPVGEKAFGCLEQQMVMVGHKTISVTDPVHSLCCRCQKADKQLTILVAEVYIFLVIASCPDVVESTWELNACGSCHDKPPGDVMRMYRSKIFAKSAQ